MPRQGPRGVPEGLDVAGGQVVEQHHPEEVLCRRLLRGDLPGGGRYVIADIEWVDAWPTERFVWVDPESNRGSTTIMPEQPDDVRRIDHQLRNEADEARLAPLAEAVLQLLLAMNHPESTAVQEAFDLTTQQRWIIPARE